MNIDQLRAVRAILRWDDTSTAAELVYYFVHELDVTPVEAWKAVYCRPPMQRGVSEMSATGFNRAADDKSDDYKRLNA